MFTLTYNLRSIAGTSKQKLTQKTVHCIKVQFNNEWFLRHFSENVCRRLHRQKKLIE